MNDTLDLFRRTSLLFAKYPLLWLPLMLAEVLRTTLQWFSLPLTRAALLAAAPRSAIGGNIAGPPAAWKINLISGSIGFLIMALSVLMLLYALGIVARALQPAADLRRHQPELHFQAPSSLGVTWLQITGLSALFFLFSAGFVSAVVAPWAGRARLTPGVVQAIILSFVVPVLLVILYIAVGPLRRFVLRVQSEQESREGARLPYFLMLVAGALFSTLASLGVGYVTRRSMPAGGVTQSVGLLTLQILIAVVTAFPYAYAMTGLSLSPEASLQPDQAVAE
ncbi:MAG: hypothetical protein ACRYF4_11910 [Janthinobacterium lividum]